jgi:glycosyltransferase involved in cell wall biosynthesis
MKGISVIICCYNSEKRIEKTLDFLFAQKNLDKIDWEIIVVDNASKDDTYNIAKKYLSNLNFNLVKELNPGLFNARKKGYEAAKFDLLLYCDDDNWLNHNYLNTVFSIMSSNDKIGILGGKGKAFFEDKHPFWFQKMQQNFAVGEQSISEENLSRVDLVYGAGFTVRKDVLNHLYSGKIHFLLSGRTGKKLISGDDNEWCVLAKQLGFEIWYSRDLEFEHFMPNGRMNWEYLKKLHVGFGRTNIYTHAYKYVEVHGKGPSNTLRLPLWLDTYIHKLKELRKFYPKVKGKFNEEGNEEVLRYFGMKGELSELWSLKKKYDTIFVTIESNIKNLKEIRSK